MAFFLAPHVHLAVLGEDVVLLDVVADAYLCVPDGRAALRPGAARERLDPVDDDLIAELRQAGLLCDSPAPRVRRPCRRPIRDLDGPLRDRPSPRELLHLAGALWDLVHRYRGRAFADILSHVAAVAPPPSAQLPRDKVLQLARRFQAWAVWLPMPRKCLARSFVLLRYLQRSGATATWVFGVGTWPFAAHCWLQVDEIALDDAWDRLAAYEPILAVG